MMKSVREQIEERFANVSPGHASALEMPMPEAPAWVLRQPDGAFGVGVPYDGETVTEDFAGARLRTFKSGQLGSQLPGMLILSSFDEKRRNEFSLLCSDFVDPGTKGRKRDRLIRNPLAWWEGWKDLLGNAVRDFQPHSVLGELLIYEYLLGTEGRRITWSGPGGSSHDIQSESGDAEVKSTLQRYGSLVHITGQYQLHGDSLYLYFVRLEPDRSGISIDDMVERLVKHPGVVREELDRRLAALGYEEGSSARRQRFTVNEVTRYPVDDSFPRITAQSFADGCVPPGIQQISYSVDLGILDGETVRLDDEFYGSAAAG